MSAIATIDAATALQPWLLAIETLVLGLVERPGLFISDWQMYCEAFSLAEELHAMLCMSFARVAKESIVGDSVDAEIGGACGKAADWRQHCTGVIDTYVLTSPAPATPVAPLLPAAAAPAPATSVSLAAPSASTVVSVKKLSDHSDIRSDMVFYDKKLSDHPYETVGDQTHFSDKAAHAVFLGTASPSQKVVKWLITLQATAFSIWERQRRLDPWKRH
ncbi:unnamed protein product [Symbiodinium microadriaticum]|nr:unnamed protein product [Symbiodinium microadriaticum]